MTAGQVARRALAGLAGLLLAACALVAWLSVRDDAPPPRPGTARGTPPVLDPGAQRARGEYLVRAGNCQGCHSEAGGSAFAGGRAIETPFGAVYASNLTADAVHGLGASSADDFWRALHHGRSRDGRLLYPAFPYPNYTRLDRADSDALFAYLRTVAPVARPDTPHDLRFPFDRQAALAVWRALFFRPGRFDADASQSAEWNRGAYLVETLGHCNACHSRRNAFGATASTLDLAGGLIPIQNWYAPSLNGSREACVADWPADEVVALLKTGVARRAVVQGPMAEVVAGSTQHLSDADLAAMATYLRALPAGHGVPSPAVDTPPGSTDPVGQGLYEKHCAGCHGSDGAGVPGAYPRLANNRAVTMATPANLVHVVLRGGFAPVTAGNPRPFGMPPFATVLSDAEVAAILSYLRSAWGNRAGPVPTLEVARYRGASR